MKIFAKYFLFIFIILEIAHVAKVNAKPVPPGSGEGDVPANILILIDSSASMRRRMSNRDAIQYVPNAIYDSNGDILASQFRNNGVVKFNADGTRNREFNDNVGRYTGNASDLMPNIIYRNGLWWSHNKKYGCTAHCRYKICRRINY